MRIAPSVQLKGRVIGNLLLKGKSASLRCWTPQMGRIELADYDAALALLEAGDPKACQAFAALVGRDDGDPLALFRLGRLLAGESGCDTNLGAT